jgi:hypothetical protein
MHPVAADDPRRTDNFALSTRDGLARTYCVGNRHAGSACLCGWTLIHRGGMRTSCSPLMFSTTPRHSMPTYGSACPTSAAAETTPKNGPDACPSAVVTRHARQRTYLLAKIDLLAHVGDGYLLWGGHQQSAIHRCSDQ